jgi:MFS transporter, ACS family, D-galactonate transporter
MSYSNNANPGDTGVPPKASLIDRWNLRPIVTGLVPLFILAHFSAHGISAMLNPLLPMIRQDLKLNLTQSGFIMSAYTVTNGFAQLPAGWLSDRLGARVVILVAITGVAIAGFLIGFSNSMLMLMILLILVALLGGGYHPAAATAISSGVPVEYRGRALGTHLIGGTSAFWVLPLVIAPIAAAWGWRMPYRIMPIPFALLGILVFILIGKYNRSDAKKQQQIANDRTPSTSPKSFEWGKLAPFMVLSIIVGGMIGSTSSFLSFYAVDKLHVPTTTIPFIVAISPAVGVVMAPVGGYLSDKFGGLSVITIFGILAVPLIYLMGVVPNVPALIALMLAIGLINNTRMPTTESFIVGNTPDNRRGTMLGIYFFAGAEVAGPLTPFIGNLIDTYGYHQTFLYSSLVTAVVTLVCALFLWKNQQTQNKIRSY